MTVHASTQDPTEVQHIVARILGIPDAFVTVETRRMGGGFGGKESQACAWAAIAALAARVTGRPCKVRLDRDDDFVLTGKRHDFRADWRVGYDDQGVIAGYDVMLNARCGCSADLSPGVSTARCSTPATAIGCPTSRSHSRRLKTNTVSNTAFRGFGGPQGMIAIERVMDAIARERGLDPLDVRKANLLRAGGERTPYGQTVEDFETQPAMIEELEASSDYRARRARIAAFNAASPILKRGIALTPVMFGISFTLIPLNQAGALVHVYSDGSIHLNHGGTEMGQGLFTKVAPDRRGGIRRAAAFRAHHRDQHRQGAQRLADRGLLGHRPQRHGGEDRRRRDQGAHGRFRRPRVGRRARGGRVPRRAGLRRQRLDGVRRTRQGLPAGARAALARRLLQDAGDPLGPARAKGRPFFYFAYGAACAEVAIDTLTGEMRVLRADMLHDVGSSINPGSTSARSRAPSSRAWAG